MKQHHKMSKPKNMSSRNEGEERVNSSHPLSILGPRRMDDFYEKVRKSKGRLMKFGFMQRIL
ncbi:MAG: hypothetical protein ACI9S8_000433 [Chlamydiales bacterium]|jgi:hypothetical protein